MLASGISETEMLEDYPYLEKADFPPFPRNWPNPMRVYGKSECGQLVAIRN